MRPPAVDAGRTEAAQAELRSALAGRPLVSVTRFTTSGRTGYTGPAPVPALRPDLAIGCYRPWTPAEPAAAMAAEERIRTRSAALRQGWLTRVRAEAAERLAGLDRPPVLTAWYATDALRALAGPHGTVAAIDGTVRDVIEAKPAFDQVLREAYVPAAVRIPAVRVDGRLPSLPELRRLVGTRRVVVQSGVTSGGRGTVIVTGEADMEHAARLDGPYRVTAFIDGWSSNVTVLSVPEGPDDVRVYVDRPSHKAIGVTELGIGPAKSAGNDWSRPWPADAAGMLVESAVRIAIWAWRRHRVAGLFGLDAILTPDGRVYLNEINCRNQGTTEVSAVNQQARGWPPFLAAHLTLLLGGRVSWLEDPHEFNHATITQATTPGGPFYAKLRLHRADPGPVCLDPRLPGSGVYRLDAAGRLEWVRAGAHPADADADRGEVLLAGLPAPDVICHPGAEIATVEGVTSGSARPFDGPDQASMLTLRTAAAVAESFLPYLPQERTS
ncbi:hypothetical protein [Planomonospora sp. ID82291]|uniref:hypothetical protein n=1 Tax=Planomonospora sp. ID82291 TaxID=2738136 RepID=UPI0018C39EFD|nr:hypothetical protein [Planomonospora sp. ID82291]MBG0819049.1 hypothetical protein [Planomonospora sp. ID82291]